MTPSDASPARLRALLAVTIFLSAFLLFLIQPLIARQILPWFGGGSGVWTACLVFFQVLLLGGYAYADLTTRRVSPRRATWVHSALLVLALLTLPVLADPSWQPAGPQAIDAPTWRILALLTATIGLPYFLLATTGPLIQAWYVRAMPQGSVYRLYALSNAGSLLALLCYPVLLEPWLTLGRQAWLWSIAFGLFATLCIASAWWALRVAPAPVAPRAEAGDEADDSPPGWRDRLLWLTLAALGSMLLLACTNHITQNVASAPFLWLAPLTLYLLSFILTFDAREGSRGWYRRGLFAPLLMLMLPAMAWGLVANGGVLEFTQALPLYLGGLFVACMFCHGELVANKPVPRHLTGFYLMVSLGGALGGLSVGLLAPQLFAAYFELPLALLLCALLLLWQMRARLSVVGWVTAAGAVVLSVLAALLATHQRDVMGWATPDHVTRLEPFDLAGAALLGVLGLLGLALLRWQGRGLGLAAGVIATVLVGHYGMAYADLLRNDTVLMQRNFYGTVRVKTAGTASEDPELNTEIRRLVHGVIMHGEQYVSERWRRLPTSYYGPDAGATLALGLTQPKDDPGGPPPSHRVGVVGLGVGTLAAYGLPGDVMRFYEINPQVVDVARSHFWYLQDSTAQVEVVLGDARLSMQAEPPQEYDVLVIDAFSSDAIPTHLLTREALQVYLRHLKPDGIIAFHVTNRYLNLPPVIQMLAQDAGLHLIRVTNNPEEAVLSYTDYVLVSRNAELLTHPSLLEKERAVDPIPGLRLWTDDYSNLLRLLK